MDHAALASETNMDPLGRGYAAMSNAEVAVDMNTAYRTRQLEQLEQGTVYNSIVPGEFALLSADEQAEVWNIVQIGGPSLWIRPGDLARERMLAFFGVGTTTRANLIAAASEDISRGVELGLGWIRESDVHKARTGGY